MTLILPPTQSLYPVLELLVDDADAVLQQAARTTLDRIAIYLGYSTTANLLKYALRTYLALTCTAYSFTDRYASDRYFSVRYTSDRYSTSLTVTSLTVTPLTVTSLSIPLQVSLGLHRGPDLQPDARLESTADEYWQPTLRG